MNYLKIVALVCILFPSDLSAQHIVIRDRMGNIVNNDTLMYSPEFTQKPPYVEIQCYFYAENAGAATIDMGVKKTEFLLGPNVDHGICFGKLCFPPAVFVAPVISTLAQGQIDSSFSGTYRYLPSTHTPAQDLVGYTFFNDDDPSDSAIVYVVCNTAGATNVDEPLEYREDAAQVVPNPVNDFASFLYRSLAGEQVSLIVVNAVGHLVDSHTTRDGKGLISLNTSRWANGMYYYHFTLGSRNALKGSLIVAH